MSQENRDKISNVSDAWNSAQRRTWCLTIAINAIIEARIQHGRLGTFTCDDTARTEGIAEVLLSVQAKEIRGENPERLSSAERVEIGADAKKVQTIYQLETLEKAA